MRASTFIKNANNKLIKRINKQVKEQNKMLLKALKDGDKKAQFKGILPQP